MKQIGPEVSQAIEARIKMFNMGQIDYDEACNGIRGLLRDGRYYGPWDAQQEAIRLLQEKGDKDERNTTVSGNVWQQSSSLPVSGQAVVEAKQGG